MPTPSHVKSDIRRLLRMQRKLFLMGGVSPFSKLFFEFQRKQQFVLGVFGLPDTPENVSILTQPSLDFIFNSDPPKSIWIEPAPIDGTEESKYFENGRKFLMGAWGVHLSTIEEQTEQIYRDLFFTARRYFGGNDWLGKDIFE